MADNRKLSALPAAAALGPDDLMYVVREGGSCRASLGQFVTFAAATMQPAAANLAALSGLEGLAGRLPYFTGTGAMAMTPTTAFGRGLLNLADAAAGRSALGAASQAGLDTLSSTTTSALALKADKTITVTGAGLVTGGGGLSASRTLTVTEASEAEALAGAVADKAMTPRRTKAVVDAAVDAAVEDLQASLDDLATGQAGGVVAAESWTVLAAYPTGDRVAGDYAKVIGADAGTHTDPVVGGTVANRGAYRWSASPSGWRRVGNLESDDAATFADNAATAAAAAVGGLPRVLAALGGDLSGMFTTKEGDETLDNQTFPPGTFGCMHPQAFGADGLLAKISVNVSATGSGRFLIRDQENQRVIWTTDVSLVAGENTFVAGADYPFQKISRGQTLGFYPSGGCRIKTGSDVPGPQKYFGFPSAPTVGESLPNGIFVTWSAPFAFSYTLISTLDPAQEPVDIESRTRVVSQRFSGTALPANWTLGSSFAINDGLVSSGAGGWGNYAAHTEQSAVVQRELAARVTFSDSESKWALAVKPPGQFHGGAFVIDGTAGKLGLYTWFQVGTAGTLDAEVDLPSLSTGVPYTARVRVNDQTVIGELINEGGEIVASVTSPNFMATDGDALAFKGSLAAIHFSGSVKVDWLEAYHVHPKRLKLLIVGDSNLSGTLTSAIGKTWGMRIAELRPQKDIMISARGGDTGQWLNRLNLDFISFKPEKVLFVLGSNYSSLSAWRADISAMISATAAAGAEPILATQIPRATAQTLMDQMNSDILGRYFGDIRVVDIAAAITDGGDRQTWHWPGTDNGDHIHMSLEGQMRAFEYVRDNCSWLWLDALNPFLKN